MNLFESLCNTYDTCLADTSLQDHNDILPIGYTSQLCHIEIVIDGNGNFQKASLLSEEEQRTIMPQLKSRTSGVQPMPLCDKIHYCAKDYESYGGIKPNNFQNYFDLISNWCLLFSTVKIKSVLEYISKGNLVQDLVKSNVLLLDNNNILLTYDKKNKDKNIFSILQGTERDQGDALIRWRVEIPGEKCSAVWEDIDIINSWMKYLDLQKSLNKDICSILGSIEGLEDNHPSKIRHEKDGAKIISSNDKDNFVFRGKFNEASQVVNVSYIASQKAHKALKWLIGRQGIRNGDQVIICWSINGKLEDKNIFSNSFDLFGEEIIVNNSDSNVNDVGQLCANRLRKAINGYKIKFDTIQQAMILGLDSVTSGRLSILFYNELKGSTLTSNLESWHINTSWLQSFKDNKGYCAPAVKEIAYCAYGDHIPDKLLKNTISNLINCIINNQKIPINLVNLCVEKTFNPIKFKKETKLNMTWDKAIGITCGLYRNYFRERNYLMSLDTNCVSRDYLYGRLWAIAEHIENLYLYVQKSNKTSKSIELLYSFSKSPNKTWSNLYNYINNICRQKLNKSKYLMTSNNLFNQIDNIINQFKYEDFMDNKPLSGESLLGLSCQRIVLEQEKQIAISASKNIEVKEQDNEEC